MIRWVTLCTLCFGLGAPPARLCAQFNPYAPAGEAKSDPRARRANRETAVARVGTNNARDFVEALGDEAVVAIFAVSKPVAEKLAECYASGDMGKLPRPRELLHVIAQPGHGDDVAMWAIHHVSELVDVDNFDAYLLSPLEYALGLKPLATGGAEMRSRRLNRAVTATAPAAAPLPLDAKLGILGGAGMVVLFAFLLWRRKKSAIG